MAEEKKNLNPSFMRASDKKIVVEQDLGPMVPNEEEMKATFVRASDKQVKVEDSMTDEELNELLKEQDELRAKLEEDLLKRQEASKVKPKPIEEEILEDEILEEDEEIFEDEELEVEEEILVEEPVKKQTLKIKVSQPEQNSDVKKVMDLLSKTKTENIIEGQISMEDILEDAEKELKKPSKPQVEEKVKPKPKVIDISNLTIVNKTEIDKERDLRQALFNNKAAFQIVAAQSGYMAKVTPLVHKDIVNILYGNLGRFEYKKAVYKTIHEKVFDTSVGKLSFEEWLKYTSVEDMETFYYGVYASTFPNEGSFRYTCPQCGEEHDYKINHNNLIKTTDRDHMRKLIEDVSANSTSIEKMKEYSLVGTGDAIQLTNSKLIMELKTPNLFDSLEILRSVPEKTIDKDAISVTNMLYINKVLIPSKETSGAYTEENNKPAILRIIDNLPIDDANELQEAVFERVDKNRITYSIKNIKCIECAHEEKDIPISIEDILFTLIFEKTQ
jgi:hypothetical protein